MVELNLKKAYEGELENQSDIREHLPTLKEYASKVDSVTEFGVRDVVSTYALLMGNPKKMISYDIKPPRDMNRLPKQDNFEFKIADILEIEIEETDLLLIDTYHVYRQLKKELELHSSKAKKYIILHDTVTFGKKGEDGGEGLTKAVIEFLASNKQWKVLHHYENNNGLMILHRI